MRFLGTCPELLCDVKNALGLQTGQATEEHEGPGTVTTVLRVTGLHWHSEVQSELQAWKPPTCTPPPQPRTQFLSLI